MSVPLTQTNEAVKHWIVVLPEPAGQYTAQAVGLPDVTASASSREEALQGVHAILSKMQASGQLVEIEVRPNNPLLSWAGRADPNDPHEKAYLEELARMRQDDLKRTLQELDEGCSNSSLTPIT
jgi:hypothetical protein